MNETAQKQEARAVVSLPEQVITVGHIVISGVQLLPDKLTQLMVKIVQEYAIDEHNSILAVRFTENLPAAASKEEMAPFAKFYPESRSMVINLNRHFVAMTDRMLNGDLYLKPYAYIWLNLIHTLCHEVCHGHQCHDKGIGSELSDELCEQCDETADLWIKEIAISNDIEPVSWEEDPYFGPVLSDFFKDLRDIDADELTPEMMFGLELEDGGATYLERKEGAEDRTTMTLRGYLRKLHGEEDNPEWDKSQPTKAVAPAAPVASPVETPVETPVTPPTEFEVHEDMVPEPEDIDDDGDVIPEGYSREPWPASTAAPVQQQQPAPVQQQPAPQQATPASQALPSVPPAGTSQPLPTIPTAGQATPAQQQAPMPQLTNHNLAPEVIEQAVYELNMAMYIHVFTKCGFMPNQDLGFTNPKAVFEPLRIDHIANIDKILVAIDTLLPNGQFLKHTDVWNPSNGEARQSGHITGLAHKDGHLPAYRVYLNINGQEVERSFLPQNPNKTYPVGHQKAGQLTTWAQLARQGNALAMFNAGGKPKIKILTAPGQPIGHPSIGGATEYEYLNF